MVYSINSTVSGFELKSYEGITESGDGTALSIYNNNRNSANTSEVVLTRNPTTLSVVGANLIRTVRSGESGTPSQRSAGSLTAGNEVIFKPNTKYSLEITNLSTSTNYINLQLEWIEK